MENYIDLLKDTMKELKIDLSNKQINQFNQYYNMLVEKNKVMNLTAITEYSEVVKKHFVDSLSIVKIIDINKIHNIIDVGTGAGFPGIPIKIVFPHVSITLLDSLNKRILFLNEVIKELELSTVELIHGRAEDFGQNKEYREKFDLCVSRAVANLSTLAEYCTPFVKIGGNFISYKAGNCEQELEKSMSSIDKLGCKYINSKSFTIPNSDISRTLIKVEKTQKLKKIYPRKAGVPEKKPL